MDPLAEKSHGLWLLVVTLVLSILGVLVLVALGSAWRRYNHLLSQWRRDECPAPPADLWKISGQRLAAQDEPPPDEDENH